MKLFNSPDFLQLFADDGAGGAGTGGEGGGAGGAAGSGDGGQGGAAGGKTFTQEDIDAIVTRRLAREQKTWETKLEDEKKKASMTEQEKLKAAAEESEKKGKTAVEAANKRIVAAEARVIASELGVKSDRIGHLLKLADLSGADVDEKGEVNTKAVKQAIEAVLKDLPELKGGGPGGFNLGGGPGSKGAAGGMNSFIRQAAGRS
jgi:alanyl-tRNA synthetase